MENFNQELLVTGQNYFNIMERLSYSTDMRKVSFHDYFEQQKKEAV